MPYVLSRKLILGISACNAGAHVRWNRAGWDRIKLLEREKDAFIWVPVCPEVNSGFGVPRHTIKLSNGTGDDFWQQKARVKNRQGRDVSQEIAQGCQTSLDILERSNIDAFVYMDGSPSCGVYRTTLRNTSRGKPPGVFGSLLLKKDLFLIPALDLESPLKWWDWRRRLHAFIWLKDQEIKSKKQLYDIWHNFKFICQEVNRKESDEISHLLADMPKKIGSTFIETWKTKVLSLVRQPSTPAKIRSVAQKHFSYYAKHLAKDKKSEISAKDIKLSSRGFTKQLTELEKIAVLKNIIFAGTPVIYLSLIHI